MSLLETGYSVLRDWATPAVVLVLVWRGSAWKAAIDSSMSSIQDDLVKLNAIEERVHSEVRQDIQAVTVEVQALRLIIATIPKEIPPAWFKEQVDRIESRVEALEQRRARERS